MKQASKPKIPFYFSLPLSGQQNLPLSTEAQIKIMTDLENVLCVQV